MNDEQTAIQRAQQAIVASEAKQSTLALAIERGLDPATIGKMMDLQERWEAGQARKSYVEAMAGFKRECPAVIGKDRRADFGQGKAKYSYATTGQIVTAITPALSKYGLSLSWETRQEGKQVTVDCHVTHAGGHRESATLTGPNDESGGKNAIQQIGSAVHYLQRYTMVSVLGLATADMDDPDEQQRPPVAMPTPRNDRREDQFAGNVATGLVSEVVVGATSKPGAPKEWKRFDITVDGLKASTFSESIANDAASYRDTSATVNMEWKDDGKGHQNVVSISAV